MSGVTLHATGHSELGDVDTPTVPVLTLAPGPPGDAEPRADRHYGGGEGATGETDTERASIDARSTCVVAVSSYVREMAEATMYPGLNGYQRRSQTRGWPPARTVVIRLGSWPQALAAAGYNAPRRAREPFVSRAECIAAVTAYAADAAKRGEHPGMVGYQRHAPSRGWPSFTTVKARLGPWTAALVAAGVSPVVDRRPDTHHCLSAVESYVEEMTGAGLYPAVRSYQAMAASRGWPSARVATARLGSWSAALEQVGFVGARRPGRRPVSRHDCLAAIQAYVGEATMACRHPGVVGYDAVQRERGWPQRQSTVMARFGSWSAALSAAGYTNPAHQRGHRVSREECLVAVGAYCAEKAQVGETPSLAGYGTLAKGRGWPAAGTVLARLGSWREAVGAATLRVPDGCSGRPSAR